MIKILYFYKIIIFTTNTVDEINIQFEHYIFNLIGDLFSNFMLKHILNIVTN